MLPRWIVLWLTLLLPAAGLAAGGLHQPYEELLATYVGLDGTVRYDAWHQSAADLARLDAYLERLQRSSPDQSPALYPSRADQLGYWLNLYNAVVLREILRRWPLSSVMEVTGSDGGTGGGKAFFKDLSVSVGSRRLSLDQLESEIIRGSFKDPRIHFVINCGSRSCPVLKREALVGPRLTQQLEAASRAFINDPGNVAVDDRQRQLVLSSIFDWYRGDFVELARARAQSPDLFGFLLLYADPGLIAPLRRAQQGAYRLVFRDYDWSLNRAAEPAPADGGFPPVSNQSWPLLDGGQWKPSDGEGKVRVIDFWATHCRPCRTSFPQLEQLYQRHRSRGLVVIGIAQEPASPAIAAFVKATGVTFPIAVDPQSASADPPWEIAQLPTRLVLDRKGVVRYRHSGWAKGDLEKLSAELKLLLQEPPR